MLLRSLFGRRPRIDKVQRASKLARQLATQTKINKLNPTLEVRVHVNRGGKKIIAKVFQTSERINTLRLVANVLLLPTTARADILNTQTENRLQK